MQVRTTFIGATDFHGEKVKAVGPHGQVTVSYDYGAYDMHDDAVRAYLRRHGIDASVPEGPDTGGNPRRQLSRSGRGYRYNIAP